MTYIDCITVAAQHAQDWDLPAELLPLVISREATLLYRQEAGHISGTVWD
jgi:hypothetical protein